MPPHPYYPIKLFGFSVTDVRTGVRVLPQRGLLRRPGPEEHTQERTVGWPAEQWVDEGGAKGRLRL